MRFNLNILYMEFTTALTSSFQNSDKIPNLNFISNHKHFKKNIISNFYIPIDNKIKQKKILT